MEKSLLQNVLTTLAALYDANEITGLRYIGHSLDRVFSYQVDCERGWREIDLDKLGYESVREIMYVVEHSSGRTRDSAKRLLKEIWDINYDNLCISIPETEEALQLEQSN